MEELNDVQSIAVRQKKEWGEILTGFETRNKYAVSDSSGRQLYWAAEESGFLARLLLKAFRPFSMHILSMAGSPVLQTKKPFRFYFHEMGVYTAKGSPLGTITREISLLSKKFTVTDAGGAALYQINAPLLHPWTFKILKDGAEVGEIVKRWSGLGKEVFTDSDNFTATFPAGADQTAKAVLLGAVFLIDIVYFEK